MMRQRLRYTEEPRSISPGGITCRYSTSGRENWWWTGTGNCRSRGFHCFDAILYSTEIFSVIIVSIRETCLPRSFLWLSTQPMAGISTCRAAAINFTPKNRFSLITPVHNENITTDTGYSREYQISSRQMYNSRNHYLKRGCSCCNPLKQASWIFIEYTIYTFFDHNFAQVISSLSYLVCGSLSFIEKLRELVQLENAHWISKDNRSEAQQKYLYRVHYFHNFLLDSRHGS